MRGAVDGVDLSRGGDIEARLFKSETQSACAGKEIDRYRPHPHPFYKDLA
ncbi:hypothetical protein SBA4_4670008 [Candidatus Sulfopaludibacter sp. SbA4]|nr:hypothetical protein SBA4_4670008 [Candidatus Sulfopaludibacter sp. SbA4]